MTTDHPRSRGVYPHCLSWTGWHCGSSPLARGLLILRRRSSGRSGIIPARAGFTKSEFCVAQHMSDHPRSRGVYATAAGPRWRPCGSSPLARGLRRGSPGGRAPGPDHPRSRGVYAGAATILPCRPRIIPARAGFTSTVRLRQVRATDHPRSRGVYETWSTSTGSRAGSSPLARGLLAPALRITGPPRIIPARAGFTRKELIMRRIEQDHPRSRGVYRTTGRGRPAAEGSSPLARGLPGDRGDRPAGGGIIPARAGFTSGWW